MSLSWRVRQSSGLTASVALLLAIAGGCATAEDLSPKDHGGAPGTGGSDESSGGTLSGDGGSSGGTVSSGGTGTGGSKAETGGRASGGTSSGTGGRARGGASTGGALSTGGKSQGGGGSSAGHAGTSTGGRSSGGGAGKATGGSADGGSGGGASICAWTSAECSAKQCAAVCASTNPSDTNCPKACNRIIDCLKTNFPECATEADLVCAKRSAMGTANKCTDAWEQGSGEPSKAATTYFNCACAGIMPGGGGGTGGASSGGGSAGRSGSTGGFGF